MVDFQTKYKQHGFKYNAPDQRRSVQNWQEFKHEEAKRLFREKTTSVHSCVLESVRDFREPSTFQAKLFAEGVRKAYDGLVEAHAKDKDQENRDTRQPEKLLYVNANAAGKRQMLSYPRDLCVTSDGEIIVADCGHNLIQVFNGAALHVRAICKGSVSRPFGVTMVDDEEKIAVIEEKRKSWKLFFRTGTHIKTVAMTSQPTGITSDGEDLVLLATNQRRVEIYNQNGDHVRHFDIEVADASDPMLRIVMRWQKIYILDKKNSEILIYSQDGHVTSRFHPAATSPGSHCGTSGCDVTVTGKILVADALNHYVNEHGDDGTMIKTLMSPVDELGAVSACAVTPEGHIAVTEFSVNNNHALKIFRYQRCDCHN